MRSVLARHVQDERRIRALRDMRSRLRSWQASERMQLDFRDPAVYGLLSCPGILLRSGFHVWEFGCRDSLPAWVLLSWWCPRQADVCRQWGMVLPSSNQVSQRHQLPRWILLHRRGKRQDGLCRRHVFSRRLNICRSVLRLHAWYLLARWLFGLYQVRPWNSGFCIGRGLLRQVRTWQVCSVHGLCFLHKLPPGIDQRTRQQIGNGVQSRQHFAGR
jgi:hypothetical protein